MNLTTPPTSPADHLTLLLRHHGDYLRPVLDLDLNSDAVAVIDFTARNPALANAELGNTPSFEALVRHLLDQKGATVGIGGYLEPRVIYRRSELFGSQGESRSIHLGVDIWAEAGTGIFAPLEAIVHSFADNAHFGDYGPTILLEHRLAGTSFYTLYGHLSRASLSGIYPGKPIPAGEHFAELGPYPENGDWPPHLHFQLITDLEGREGDYPGVAAPAEVEHYKARCPDPNLVLRCEKLKDEWMNGYLF